MVRLFKTSPQNYSPMRDYMRLVIMLVMLLIVLGMFYTLQSHTQPPPAQPAHETPQAEIPVTLSPPSGGAPQGQQDEAKLLAQVHDDAPIERKPYYYMLGKVFNMTPKEIDDKVDPAITPFDCLAHPAKYRGKFVRFDGSLWRLKQTRMNPDSGFEAVWEGTIARQGPIEGPYVFCTVILTGKPGPEIQPEKSNVLFTGVFLKTIVYENRGEADEMGRRNLTKSPLFIGKELAIASPPQIIGTGESLLYLFLGLAALAVFAYFILFHRDKGAHERHFEISSDDDMADVESEPSPGEEQSSEPEAPPEEEPSEPPGSPPDEEKTGEDEEPSSPGNDSSGDK
ncbi:MAG: hypothetical protein GXP25_13255 [Planctomycetes bacterium]|nr:hypothetical protein [Planctomycetota bacterium]